MARRLPPAANDWRCARWPWADVLGRLSGSVTSPGGSCAGLSSAAGLRPPAAYLLEALLAPLPLALLGFAAVPGPVMAALAALSWLVCSGLAAASERRLGIRRPLLLYPLLEIGRSSTALSVWALSLLVSRVRWRGHRLRVGPRTRLDAAAVPVATGEESSESAAAAA